MFEAVFLVCDTVGVAIDTAVKILEHAKVEHEIVIKLALTLSNVDIIIALLINSWRVAVPPARDIKIDSGIIPVLRREILSDEVDGKACLFNHFCNIMFCELFGIPLISDRLRK